MANEKDKLWIDKMAQKYCIQCPTLTLFGSSRNLQKVLAFWQTRRCNRKSHRNKLWRDTYRLNTKNPSSPCLTFRRRTSNLQIVSGSWMMAATRKGSRMTPWCLSAPPPEEKNQVLVPWYISDKSGLAYFCWTWFSQSWFLLSWTTEPGRLQG